VLYGRDPFDGIRGVDAIFPGDRSSGFRRNINFCKEVNMKEKSTPKMGRLIEAVIAHPKDAVTVKEIYQQVPHLGHSYIQNNMSNRMITKGYLEKGKRDAKRIRTYVILSRTPHKRRRTTKQSAISPGPIKPAAEKKRDHLYSVEVGESIILAFNKLKTRFNELGSSHSNLQSEYNKETVAHRQSIRERDKSIALLKETVGRLRTRIKEIENERKGSMFSMSEIAQTTRGGIQM